MMSRRLNGDAAVFQVAVRLGLCMYCPFHEESRLNDKAYWSYDFGESKCDLVY